MNPTKLEATHDNLLLRESKLVNAFKRNYFFTGSVFMLVLSVIGFSDNLIFDVSQKSNSDPKFVVHGLFFLAWYIMLVVQTRHVSRRNFKAHIALGVTGMLIAVGVVP